MPGFVVRGICGLVPNMASTKLRVLNPGTPSDFQLPLLRAPVQATPRGRTQKTSIPTPASTIHDAIATRPAGYIQCLNG